MAPGKNQDDFDLEGAFNDDLGLDDLFGEKPKPSEAGQNRDRFNTEGAPSPLDELDGGPAGQGAPFGDGDFTIDDDSSEEDNFHEERRRSSKDFELNMDAILLTAQSAMIMEGIKAYSNKDFSPATLPIYNEALKGIDLYIKIIDRNPNNYVKLKKLIDTDIDCQRVENTVFNLFKKVFSRLPDDNVEKILAFEKFRLLFESALNKASISASSKMIKKYYLITGGIDEKKVSSMVESRNREIMSDMNSLTGHVQMAMDMVKNGNFELVKGLRGKDLNAYIINGTELLAHYFGLMGNTQVASHYRRIHGNFKKYFITK